MYKKRILLSDKTVMLALTLDIVCSMLDLIVSAVCCVLPYRCFCFLHSKCMTCRLTCVVMSIKCTCEIDGLNNVFPCLCPDYTTLIVDNLV